MLGKLFQSLEAMLHDEVLCVNILYDNGIKIIYRYMYGFKSSKKYQKFIRNLGKIEQHLTAYSTRQKLMENEP